MADKPTSQVDFSKVALVVYAPDAASQEAARVLKEQIEQGGGKLEIRNQQPPYSYPGIH